MTTPSMHIDLITLQTNLEEVAEAAHVLGQRYAGTSAIPEEMRTTLDGYKRTADLFNEIGSRMHDFGLQLLYHNHGYGLVEMEGEIPLKVILERTDPRYVVFEMDIFWTTAGRADPIALLVDYPGRYKLMHLKDMTEIVHFNGDGGTSDQWIELFPYTADAGEGALDLPGILEAALDNGVEHFYLERDIAQDPDRTLQASYDYLAALELEAGQGGA
jgi:sugar phosphate isomerase/epimerase